MKWNRLFKSKTIVLIVLAVLVVVVAGSSCSREMKDDAEGTKRPPRSVRDRVRDKCRDGALLEDIWESKWDKYDKSVLQESCRNGMEHNKNQRETATEEDVADCRYGLCPNPILRGIKPCRNKSGTKCCKKNGDDCTSLESAERRWNITKVRQTADRRAAAAANKNREQSSSSSARWGTPGGPVGKAPTPGCKYRRKTQDSSGAWVCKPGWSVTGNDWNNSKYGDKQCEKCPDNAPQPSASSSSSGGAPVGGDMFSKYQEQAKRAREQALQSARDAGAQTLHEDRVDAAMLSSANWDANKGEIKCGIDCGPRVDGCPCGTTCTNTDTETGECRRCGGGDGVRYSCWQ